MKLATLCRVLNGIDKATERMAAVNYNGNGLMEIRSGVDQWKIDFTAKTLEHTRRTEIVDVGSQDDESRSDIHPFTVEEGVKDWSKSSAFNEEGCPAEY